MIVPGYVLFVLILLTFFLAYINMDTSGRVMFLNIQKINTNLLLLYRTMIQGSHLELWTYI